MLHGKISRSEGQSLRSQGVDNVKLGPLSAVQSSSKSYSIYCIYDSIL